MTAAASNREVEARFSLALTPRPSSRLESPRGPTSLSLLAPRSWESSRVSIAPVDGSSPIRSGVGRGLRPLDSLYSAHPDPLPKWGRGSRTQVVAPRSTFNVKNARQLRQLRYQLLEVGLRPNASGPG